MAWLPERRKEKAPAETGAEVMSREVPRPTKQQDAEQLGAYAGRNPVCPNLGAPGCSGATWFREDTEVIDFFAPPRDDFLLGGKPAYMSED